jgi:hypothetical protein
MGDLIPANISMPAHLQRRNAAASITSVAAGGLTSGSSYPRISIRASRFHLVEDGTTTTLPDLFLSTVIVGANPRLSKTFYASQYDGGDEPKAPDCYSLDGIKPAADATSKQAALCASCPKNAWGSKITPQGKQAKACADKKRLAVLAADDPTGSIYLLEVTPAAFPDFAQYVRNLQLRGIHVETVRTKISFDNKASFPKLTFQFGGFLDEAGQDSVDQRLDDPVIKEITGEAVKEAEEEALFNTPQIRTPSVVAAEAYPEAKGGFGKKAAAPAPVEAKPAPAPAGGFGKKAGVTKPAPKPAPVEEPVEAPVAKSASLSDEIAALIGNLDDDD